MKRKIIVRGPILSQSGYGEQARFALNALKTKQDIFDIYVLPTGWGQTGWQSSHTEFRQWVDALIKKTAVYIAPAQEKGKQHLFATLFDISLQITIPNEWERLAPVNIGYTAGIETTKVSYKWLEKCQLMDKIIVVSNHAKEGFEKSVVYTKTHEMDTNLQELRCHSPIEVVNYCVRKETPTNINLDLDYDFNFLCMAQFGPRKNLPYTIKWFIEENFDREVGLIVKTSIKNNCIIDREHAEKALKNIVAQALGGQNCKCKVYLLHGDMSPQEIAGLYTHPKIKTILTATHGEGFGLPLFEAACHGLPVIAPGWSGQCDFLYMPDSRRKNNSKLRPMFASVEYDIAPVQNEAVWEGVIEKDSSWCYPREVSFKRRMRESINKHSQFKKNATKLQKWILKEFSEEKQYTMFCDAVYRPNPEQAKVNAEWNKKLENMESL